MKSKLIKLTCIEVGNIEIYVRLDNITGVTVHPETNQAHIQILEEDSPVIVGESIEWLLSHFEVLTEEYNLQKPTLEV